MASTLQQRGHGGGSTSRNDDAPASPSKTAAGRRRRQPKKSGKKGGLPMGVVLGMTGMLAVWIAIPLYLFRYGHWRDAGSKPNSQVLLPPDRGGGGPLREAQPLPPRPIQQPKGQQESAGWQAVMKKTTTDGGGGGGTAPKSAASSSSRPLRKLESEQIDMRDMSATLPFDDKDGGVWKQGWDVVPKQTSEDAPLHVFVVPHSHCDPGWIKTFDDYFRSQTSGIITSVVDALALDSNRKFIWAEISYFEWWWRDQGPEQREKARKLLQNGQLEFVTGGWVQPDEANTELYAMELQLQEGHAWIRNTLGEQFIPKYGWSIDPFGYSPTMAYLLKKYGFEGMLIQRVHYAVKKELASKQQLEFIWRYVYRQTVSLLRGMRYRIV